MTLKFSDPLSTTLAGATSMLDWSTKLKTSLGTTLRVRCWRDANSAAADPSVTGTEFLNAGTTGGITLSGARISGIGKIVGVTKNLAADLSSGASVLRIEGNGHYVQGTLGLPNSGADFIMTASPTGSTGLASNINVLPPVNRSSGTGYVAPALDADAPAYIIIDDWRDSSNVVEAGRIHFNNRVKDWIFEDAEIASNLGDWRVAMSTESVTFVDHEIGALLLTGDSRVGVTAGKTVHRVVVNFKPTAANWPNYPALSGYKQGTRTVLGVAGRPYGISNTFPSPFKVRVMTADDRLLGTIDMDRDHLPINSSQLSEVITASKPLRMHMHCASLLQWQSHDTTINTNAKKWVPGVDSSFLRPSLMKLPKYVNGAYAPFSHDQYDGINHWYAAPNYSIAANKAAIDADIATRTANDPYLFGAGSTYAANTPSWASFYGVPAGDMASGLTYGLETVSQTFYEPGAYGCHDQKSGPGGIRPDRGYVPAPIQIHMTNPNWVHARSGLPISTMVKHWNKGYLNHPVHFFTDVKSFGTLPVQDVLDKKWLHYGTYYNSDALFGLDTDHVIPMFTQGTLNYADQLHGGAFVDTAGRMPWNGANQDFHHNYDSRALAGAIYNDPVLILSAKHRYLYARMALLNYKPSDHFMIRPLAWIFKHHADMWKLASDHPLGISRETIEAECEADLMDLYVKFYVPLKLKNDQSMKFRTLRNLGMPCQASDTYGWALSHFTLQYYIGHSLQMWRQLGFYSAMVNRSPACKAVILMIIEILDKGCLDYYLDTDGHYSGSIYNDGVDVWIGDRTTGLDSVEVAASWADWQARKNPKASAQEDLIHDSTGAIRKPDIGEWSRMQWAFIRRDFFPDIPATRDVAACCAKIAGWQQALADYAASKSTPLAIAADEPSCHPAVARILAPTTLGPA